MIIREIRSEEISDYVNLSLTDVKDWQKITEEGLTKASWEELSTLERWQQGGWWVDQKLVELHFQILKEAKGKVLVAINEETNEIVGSLDYVIDEDQRGKVAHIIWMIVKPLERRKGIGGELLDELKRKSKEKGVKFIDVQFEDERSKGLYLKNGFTLREKLYRVELSYYDYEEEEKENPWEESQKIDWEEELCFSEKNYFIGYYYPARYEWLKAAYVEKREEILERSGQSIPEARKVIRGENELIGIFGREAHLWIKQEEKKEEILDEYLRYSFMQRDTIIANVSETVLKMLEKKGFDTKAEEAEVLTFNL